MTLTGTDMATRKTTTTEEATATTEPLASELVTPVTEVTTETTAAAPAPSAEPARDPNEPIGTPPSGGRWTWDIPGQAWLQLDAPSA